MNITLIRTDGAAIIQRYLIGILIWAANFAVEGISLRFLCQIIGLYLMFEALLRDFLNR